MEKGILNYKWVEPRTDMRHMEVSENQDNPRNVKLPKLITINYLNHKISFGHLINHTSFHKI